MSIRAEMEELLEAQKGVEAELAALKAKYERQKKEGAYTSKGEKEVERALATVARHLKNNKQRAARNWLNVVREEMIQALDF